MLIVFAVLVFAFQYITLERQIVHDELQDVATVEGLLYVDASGQLQLHQEYFSRPQSHLLIDRLMEVRDLAGNVVFRSRTLNGQSLGGALKPHEGDGSLNEQIVRLANGEHVLSISHIHGIAGHDYVIRLGYSLSPLVGRMWQFLSLLLLALAFMIAVTALVGTAVAGKVLSPLGEMTARAAGIREDSLHHRLSVLNPHDELGTLATAFNNLLERLEQSFDQLQRFTSDAAHELRTPLASLRAVGEVALSEDHTPEEYRDIISSLLEEANRLGETVDSLLLLARAEKERPDRSESFALVPLIDEVIAVLGILAEERAARIEFSSAIADQTHVFAERALIRTALMNVIHNAIKFSPEGGRIRVSLKRASPTSTAILIEDEGQGLSAADARRVFERFYTGRQDTAAAMKGIGLGLSISDLILRRAGGSIHFDADYTDGARCIIELPVQAPEISVERASM